MVCKGTPMRCRKLQFQLRAGPGSLGEQWEFSGVANAISIKPMPRKLFVTV